MPYRKKMRRISRRAPRKRRVYAGKPIGSSLVLSNRRLYPRRKPKPEMHMVDHQISTQPGTTANVTHLTDIAEGDDIAQRSGRRVFVKGISFMFRARIDTDNVFGDFCRVVVMQDKQQVPDTNLGWGTIFAGGGTDLMAPIGANTLGRAKILYDNLFALGSGGSSAPLGQVSASGVKCFRGYIPVNSYVEYNSTASTDIQKNGIYLYFISEHNTAGQLTEYNGWFRTKFLED